MFGAVWRDDEFHAKRFLSSTCELRKLTDAVKFDILWQWPTNNLGNRGEQINLADQRVRRRAGRDLSWPTHNKRYAMSAFPSAELETLQFSIQPVPCFPGLLPSVVKHAAVVAGKQDHRVVGNSMIIKHLEHFTYHPIQLMDEVAIQPALAATMEALVGCKRMVDMRRRQIQKERLVPVFSLAVVYPLHSLLGKGDTNRIVAIDHVRLLGPADYLVATLLRPSLGC